MSASHGQKVTTDPESTRNPIHEGVGTVTSDSLAAESLKQSGDFGTDNPKAAASKQPSRSSNLNNTDTSNAVTLDAAVDAQAREAKEGWNVEASQGRGKESGVGPTYNTIGSSVNSSGTGRGVSTTSQVGYDGVQGNVAPQASYAGDAVDPRTQKPKGANITEDPELSGKRSFAEVGTNNDPGRVAELEFEKRSAAVSGIGNEGSGGGKGGNVYGALEREDGS